MKPFAVALPFLLSLALIASAKERPPVISIPGDGAARPVAAEEMARIHDEGKTPFKYGVVITGPNARSSTTRRFFGTRAAGT